MLDGGEVHSYPVILALSACLNDENVGKSLGYATTSSKWRITSAVIASIGLI